MGTMTDSDFVTMLVVGFLVYTVVSFVIFLIIREGVCWYFKINERVALLRSIDERLASHA